MTDNDVVIALKSEIEAQLASVRFSGFTVARAHQPTNQFSGGDKDSDSGTMIYISEPTRGSYGKSHSYSESTKTDYQHRTKTVQISVLHYFDYRDVSSRTPIDVTDLIHDLLDSYEAIRSMRQKGIEIQEVKTPRPSFSTNEKDHFESMPSFDVVLNYQTSIVKSMGSVTAVNGELQHV